MSQEELQLQPFRHQWTIENFRWMAESEDIEGRPSLKDRIYTDSGEFIYLEVRPRGIEASDDDEMYMAIGVSRNNIRMAVYAKVKVGGDESTEREVKFADGDGNYLLAKYLRRSILLESANLLVDGALTICIEGVLWNRRCTEYDPKANLTAISALLANTAVSSSCYAFRPPSPAEYFSTEWNFAIDQDGVRKGTLDLAHLVEVPDGRTILGSRLARGDTKSFFLYLQLLQNSTTNRVAMWWVWTTVDGRGKRICSRSQFRIWAVGNKYHYGQVAYIDDKQTPSCLRMNIEGFRFTDADETPIPEGYTRCPLNNNRDIYGSLSSVWLQKARQLQRPPAPLPLPVSLVDSIFTKLQQLLSLIEQYDYPLMAKYNFNLAHVNCTLNDASASEELLLQRMTPFLLETAAQLQVLLNTPKWKLPPSTSSKGKIVAINKTRSSASYTAEITYLVAESGQVQYTIRVDDQQGLVIELQQTMRLAEDSETDGVLQIPEIEPEQPSGDSDDLLLTKLMALLKSTKPNIVNQNSYNLTNASIKNALINMGATSSSGDFKVNEQNVMRPETSDAKGDDTDNVDP